MLRFAVTPNFVGQRREAAARQALVEHRGEEPAVHHAWVAAEVGPDVDDGHERLSAPVLPRVGRYVELARS